MIDIIDVLSSSTERARAGEMGRANIPEFAYDRFPLPGVVKSGRVEEIGIGVGVSVGAKFGCATPVLVRSSSASSPQHHSTHGMQFLIDFISPRPCLVKLSQPPQISMKPIPPTGRAVTAG